MSLLINAYRIQCPELGSHYNLFVLPCVKLMVLKRKKKYGPRN